jgi:hypothetical protein
MFDDLRIELFPIVLILVFGIAWALQGLLSAAFIAAGVWLLYWLVWVFRYATTKLSWKHAAGELGFGFHQRDSGMFPEEEKIFMHFVETMTPNTPRFELTGTFEGRDARMFIQGASPPVQTVWEIDTTEALPEWLMVRPSSLGVTADRWLDLEDVSVAHDELDNRAVIGGAGADEVREWFWKTEFADELVDLLDEYGDFQIVDGRVQLVRTGIVRNSEPLREPVDRLRKLARGVAEAAQPVDERAEADVQEEAEESVHVWG